MLTLLPLKLKSFNRQLLLLFTLMILPTSSFSVCYTVYDSSDRPVYKSYDPPFDMSLPISEGIQSKFPGGYLIQSDERSSCSLPPKANPEVVKKNKEAFEKRKRQLQSDGFAEVPSASVLSFPKQKNISNNVAPFRPSPSTQHVEIIEEMRSANNIAETLIDEGSLTMNCPPGTYQWVDGWGNKVCKRHFSEEVTAIQGSLEHCPTGTHPWIDSWGNKVCQSFDNQQQYYDTSQGCPMGSHNWVDEWGNRICKKF